ncbi:outer membrane lipoprotein-sorting protein [Treponema zioleckii]|uniref:outer membrane lipoprotein-sorting protein n=1 Tax=Treponema zioleckii TaxID=331680 RepID=UPI00168B134F|nr:outer membrane lipoprotein-sorting protein [Treponema zioleckii]
MKLTKLLAPMAFALTISSYAFADEAYDVMKKFSTLKAPDYSESQMNLDVIEKSGKVDHQVMMQYGNRKNGLINTVFEFVTSKESKGTRVLQMEKTAKDDDRWIYMPSLRQTRRIPSSERSKSFVGCEFTYNDMSIRHVDDDTHEMVNANESITINGNTNGAKYGTATYNCWKIKSTPVKKSTVEYSYRYSWIDKNTYLPVKMEYYDKKDTSKLYKTFIIEKVETVTGATGIKYPLRRSCLITNEITGRKTRVSVTNIKWDKKIPDSYFTQNWLTTGKAK